jgi:hypothetical protein
MKTNGVSKKPLKKNESLRDRVEEDLNKIKGNPSLVRSFFWVLPEFPGDFALDDLREKKKGPGSF